MGLPFYFALIHSGSLFFISCVFSTTFSQFRRIPCQFWPVHEELGGHALSGKPSQGIWRWVRAQHRAFGHLFVRAGARLQRWRAGGNNRSQISKLSMFIVLIDCFRFTADVWSFIMCYLFAGRMDSRLTPDAPRLGSERISPTLPSSPGRPGTNTKPVLPPIPSGRKTNDSGSKLWQIEPKERGEDKHIWVVGYHLSVACIQLAVK